MVIIVHDHAMFKNKCTFVTTSHGLFLTFSGKNIHCSIHGIVGGALIDYFVIKGTYTHLPVPGQY
jgi:hypothetical protein